MRDGNPCGETQLVLVVGQQRELALAVVTAARAAVTGSLGNQQIQVVAQPDVGGLVDLDEGAGLRRSGR